MNTNDWLHEVRLIRAANLKTDLLLAECGVPILRELATEAEPLAEGSE